MSRSISVLMPMYNAESHIEKCLTPLIKMMARGEVQEIIVIDDCSTDTGPDIVRSLTKVKLLKTETQSGPAAARNQGARQAKGELLWVVDSDVIVADDAAQIVSKSFAESDVAAIFGSYDKTPEAQNFLSQYKNLVHRYYHQFSRKEASTFWAGCGVLRKTVFDEVGGFDPETYRYPSIEDIDLGYRIRDAGYRIHLIPELQCKHLKDWRFANLIHTEIFRRAIPWSRIMIRRQGLTDELNVGKRERIRAAIAGIATALLLGWLIGLISWIPLTVGLGVVLVANWDFVRFFVDHKSWPFALRALAFHQLYYLYSASSFVVAVLESKLTGHRTQSS